jgi:hypothetical protein
LFYTLDSQESYYYPNLKPYILSAIPVFNKNTHDRWLNFLIFRNHFISLSHLQNTNHKARFEYWLQRMKGIISSNSLKSDFTDEKNLHELSQISSSQSRTFEIVRQVFIGFSCK